jgi:hypothetical protein
MAHVLKHYHGCDALALGHDSPNNNPKTVDMLTDWADVILIMQKGYEKAVPERNTHKVHPTHVGPDVWGNPLDPMLMKSVSLIAKHLMDQGILKRS